MRRKLGKSLCSLLITTTMLFGLFPGMSLTAYAAEKSVTFTAPGTQDGIAVSVGSYDPEIGLTVNSSFSLAISFGDKNITKIEITRGSSYVANFTDSNIKVSAGNKSIQGDVLTVTDISGGSVTFSANSKKYWHAGKIVVYYEGSHDHSFTYTDSGDSITATCSAADCTLTDSQTTLTIAAPELTTYGGTGSAAATLTGLTDFNSATGKSIAETDIKYIGRDGTTYAESATAPTDAGKYTAKITVEEKTASVNYEIAKVDPTAPTGLTATYGQTLADVELPTGWTWADSTQSVGNVVTPAATFKANFAGNDNYNAASNVDVTVTVSKAANPATVTGTATVMKGGNTVDLADNVALNGATGEVTYVIDSEANGCILSGSVLTSGDNTGSVTVNVSVAADNNYEALAATPITVTISDKGTQTITASDVTVTYGETGKKVEATTDGNGAISYAVKEGSAEYINVDTSTGALTIKKVGTATVIVTAAETSTYAQATKEVTVTINKANPTVTAPTAKTLTYNGQAQELVNAGSVTGGTLYYAVTTENTAPADNLYTASIPTATAAGTHYVWYKVVGDANHNDTTPESVTSVIRAEISCDVTFTVVNGSWDDDTTADKTVTLTGYDGDTLTLSADQIPAVGTKPADTYKDGAWDVTPSADTEITADTTYTYTYEKAPLTGWQKIDGEWYFYDMSGEKQKDWEQIDGEWYYLDPETGAMQTGWQEIDGKWYCLGYSGEMLTGWTKGSDSWYYLDPETGAMQTGWKEIDGKWYFFESSGKMFTGWRRGNGSWYYLNASGAMQIGWLEIDGEWYYFNTDGTMAAYEYCNGYWLDSNGTWTYQYRAYWKQDSNGRWYGDSNGWYAKNETLKIDGAEYTFNAEGYLAET